MFPLDSLQRSKMMRRGLKRKLDKILDNFEEEPDPYQQGLGDFQSAARKRESMRIKNQVRDGFGYFTARLNIPI